MPTIPASSPEPDHQPSRRAAIPLFAATLFMSAALLFVAEPMMGKLILPLLGGTPAVWNTCVMFFQFELLVGYLYAHLIATRLSFRTQVAMQIGLLAAGLLTLPLAVHGLPPAAVQRPISTVLLLLLRSVGLPLLAIAASAPLLQRWLATTRHPAARDPFFLYAASNLGSLIALLAYPFAIEPMFRLVTQRWAWSGAYGVLLALTAACAWYAHRTARAGAAEDLTTSEAERGATGRSALTWWQRGRWLLLAFVPSSLMLSATTYISTDIAAVPLLWVVTLGLYLLTYVLAFARRQVLPLRWMNLLLPVALAGAMYCMSPGVGIDLVSSVPVHLAALFIAAFVCHAQLAGDRPSAARLTEYYLWISVGGLMGGVFNTIIAPLAFTRTVEYPLGLVLVALLRLRAPKPQPRARWHYAVDLAVPVVVGLIAFRMPPSVRVPFTSITVGGPGFVAAVPLALALMFSPSAVRFGLAMAAVVFAGMFGSQTDARVLHVERTFFGVHRVIQRGERHQLMHGTTDHGAQSFRPENRCDPLTYYSRTSPVGQLFESFVGEFTKLNVAGIGLGAATIAAYAQPYQQWTFFEINPAVERIAQDPRYFTYLRDCVQRYRIVIGDARLEMGRQPDARFDVMVFDAFSSDAIPLHLATREALVLYLRKLAPRGVMAFHISNRHLDLGAPLGNLARDVGLVALMERDQQLTAREAELGKAPSEWVVMARQRADFGDLPRDPRWMPVPTSARPVWTDDYSNILSALKIWHRQ